VRNACFTWLRKQKAQPLETPFEEQLHAGEEPNPEEIQIEKAGREVLEQEIGKLPAEYQEVLVLREMEGLSYRQIASITGVPVGTVMSRLARSRRRLAEGLAPGRGAKT
jgi:RNA polymerase sigma-70 factor (ECF subfamily)